MTPSPAAQWLKAEADHAGRVRVLPDMSVPGRPEIFVVGDTTSASGELVFHIFSALAQFEQGDHTSNGLK